MELSLQTTEDGQIFFAVSTPQKNVIVNDSIKNITICKNVYKNIYSTVTDFLHQAFNYTDKELTKKIVKDLQLSYFLLILTINIMHKIYQERTRIFFNELGRFPGSSEFPIVPQGNIQNFINTSDIRSPSDLYNRFRASDARELVSVQMLASLHMCLGASPSLSQRTMTEFYHNLSIQALSKSNDSVRLEFVAIVDLVKNIAQVLNDSTEAAIVRTGESDRYFESFLDKKEKEQQNMDEIDKATTKTRIEIKKITPPTVP